MASRTSIIACVTALLALTACSEEQAAERTAPTGPKSRPATAPFQRELVDLAFDAVSKFPVDNDLNVKNRSRAQETVVDAALDLGLLDRSAAYAEDIVNWRRGVCLANLAAKTLEYDESAKVQDLLEMAGRIAEQVRQDPNEQKWRHDRVVARIARAKLKLGQAEEVARMVQGLEASEMPIVAAARAEVVRADAYDRQLEIVDEICKVGDFEQVRGALLACTRFFDRFYDDEARRGAAEQRVVHGYKKLPVPVRIELISEIVEVALDREDLETAKRLITAADDYKVQAKFRAEDDTPLVARLAGLRGRVGDVEQARKELKEALADFDGALRTIPDMFRARALRPVAEAYQSFGDTEAAHAVFARAIEDGALNPNSRPRAIDLSETCCSMAKAGVEPSAELLRRMTQIRDQLGSPW